MGFTGLYHVHVSKSRQYNFIDFFLYIQEKQIFDCWSAGTEESRTVSINFLMSLFCFIILLFC